MAMKESSKRIFKYLQSLDKDVNVTSQDVAEALDMDKKSVDGTFTSSIQRKKLGFREEAEVELDDGTHKTVKFLRLTDEGYDFDVDAPEEK